MTVNPTPDIAEKRFRPARGLAVFWFLCGLPFVLVAALFPWSLGPERLGWWLGLATAGAGLLSCVLIPLQLGSTVVTVGSAGISKTPRWDGGFAVAWSQVLSWSVSRPPAWHERNDSVRIRVEGKRREAVVFDVEVGRPGFTAFVDTLRVYAADREVVTESDERKA